MRINRILCVGLISLAVMPGRSVFSQVSPGAAPAKLPRGAAEVAKLTQAGVGEEVVLGYVANSQALYNLSANDILALKNAGVSSPVIAAMMNHDTALRSQQSQPVPESNAYAPAPAPAPQPQFQATPQPAVASASTAPPAPVAAAAPAPPPAPSTVIVEQAPPAPQVEVIPIAPGPDYYWTPGYWSWRHGTWVWVGGCYLHRPHPGAVWVGGHWGRHGRGYIWIGGRWRL